MAVALRIHHDLYRGPKLMKDPGDAGIIHVSQDLQICEMTSGASNETRTLANPTKPGIRFVLRLKTDGGGDVVVYAQNGFNSSLETHATFADASDILSLVSVSTSSAYRWEIMEGNVGAVISTSTGTTTGTASLSSSTTATATPSSSTTRSASSSSTQSISGSDTASGTFSASTTASTSKSATTSSSTTPSGTASSSTSSTATATGTP